MYLDEFRITSTYEDHRRSGRPLGTDFGTPIGTKIKLYEGGIMTINVDQYGAVYASVIGERYNWLYVHLDNSNKKLKSGYYEGGKDLLITGNTGWSTGAHTHLTCKTKTGKSIDPMLVIEDFKPKQDLILGIFNKMEAQEMIRQLEELNRFNQRSIKTYQYYRGSDSYNYELRIFQKQKDTLNYVQFRFNKIGENKGKWISSGSLDYVDFFEFGGDLFLEGWDSQSRLWRARIDIDGVDYDDPDFKINWTEVK